MKKFEVRLFPGDQYLCSISAEGAYIGLEEVTLSVPWELQHVIRPRGTVLVHTEGGWFCVTSKRVTSTRKVQVRAVRMNAKDVKEWQA